MKELQILSPDGQSRLVPLEGEGVSLGRSSAADLCYASDNALSKKHLAIEKDGDGWALRDLGSKNGTMLNGVKIDGANAAEIGRPDHRRAPDHHLRRLPFEGRQARRRFRYAARPEANTSSGTVITQLEGLKER